MSFELGPKRLELLHEVVPAARIIGLLINPANPYAEKLAAAMAEAARLRDVQLQPVHASSDRDLDAVFAALGSLRAEALLTSPDPFLNSRSEQLALLTVRHAMPTVFHVRSWPIAPIL